MLFSLDIFYLLLYIVATTTVAIAIAIKDTRKDGESKIMQKFAIIFVTLFFITNISLAQASLVQDAPCLGNDDLADETGIRKVIKTFVKGIDNQNGDEIMKTFYEGSSLFAFKPDGKGIVTLSAKQFAAAHQAKKFGGQKREFHVKDLSVTDGLQASANVTAFNEIVFYNYRLTFIKQEGKWLIVNMMQRSRQRHSAKKESAKDK